MGLKFNFQLNFYKENVVLFFLNIFLDVLSWHLDIIKRGFSLQFSFLFVSSHNYRTKSTGQIKGNAACRARILKDSKNTLRELLI